MKYYRDIKRWMGLLLSMTCFLCFGYALVEAYRSMKPMEPVIRYAELEPLPRGLTSIEKLLSDRIPNNSTTTTSIVAYRYEGHTLYDVVKGNDSLTIPAHITDTMPPVFITPSPEVTEWHDSLLCGTIALDRYALDYRRIIARYDGQVCRIEWNSFDSIPIYIISLEGHDEPIYINATTPYVKPFYLDEALVTSAVKAFSQADSVTTEWLTEYDDYYLDLNKNLTLPVWKTIVDDHTYYINPRTGAYQSFNTASTWLYLKKRVLPLLRYKLFAKHPERWIPTMWGIVIAGAFISLICMIKILLKWRKDYKKQKTNIIQYDD